LFEIAVLVTPLDSKSGFDQQNNSSIGKVNDKYKPVTIIKINMTSINKKILLKSISCK